MDGLLAIMMGVGLSAAAGFRVFLPLLVMSVAAHGGHLTLHPDFAWLGSEVAILAFFTATVAEITGYYVPWVDNLLDSLAAPAAVTAGTVMTAAAVSDMSPFMQWSLAAIAGGGVAGTVSASTAVLRGFSSLGTGGLGNPVLATAENVGSTAMAGASILIPPVAFLATVGLFGFVTYRFLSGFSKKGDLTSEPVKLEKAQA